MNKVFFFEKKTFSSSEKPSLQKWEGAKNAGGSWPSCLFSDLNIAFMIHKFSRWSADTA